MNIVSLKQYFYDDKPPLGLTLSVTFQSALIALVNFTFLLVIFRHANLDPIKTTIHLQWLLIAYLISVFMQCFRYSPGCGYFMPATSPAVYLGPALLAITLGGLPLMIGMMIFAGICEFLLSFILHKIRFMLPKEIAGLALLAVGIQVSIVGFKYAIVVDPSLASILITTIILMTIAIFSVWGKGTVRNLAIFFGSMIGLLCLYFFPINDNTHINDSFLRQLSWIGLPSWHSIWSMEVTFKPSLMPLFLFASFAAMVRVIGVLLIAQSYEDQGWKRPNFKLIKKAVRGDALSCIFSSFLNGLGLNVAPVTTTLAINARCTSKIISYGLVIIYLALACSPKLIGYFCLMPGILIGALMLYYT